MMPRHPLLQRFRSEPDMPPFATQADPAILSHLRAVVVEQQNQIRELQFCVAALLDAVADRGMVRLSTMGLPTRDRHDDQGRALAVGRAPTTSPKGTE